MRIRIGICGIVSTIKDVTMRVMPLKFFQQKALALANDRLPKTQKIMQ